MGLPPIIALTLINTVISHYFPFSRVFDQGMQKGKRVQKTCLFLRRIPWCFWLEQKYPTHIHASEKCMGNGIYLYYILYYIVQIFSATLSEASWDAESYRNISATWTSIAIRKLPFLFTPKWRSRKSKVQVQVVQREQVNTRARLSSVNVSCRVVRNVETGWTEWNHQVDTIGDDWRCNLAKEGWEPKRGGPPLWSSATANIAIHQGNHSCWAASPPNVLKWSPNGPSASNPLSITSWASEETNKQVIPFLSTSGLIEISDTDFQWALIIVLGDSMKFPFTKRQFLYILHSTTLTKINQPTRLFFANLDIQ